MGFPGSSAGNKSACNAGDPGSIPGSGRSPGEGHGNPLQYSCLENPMDRGAWRATVHGVTKSQNHCTSKHSTARSLPRIRRSRDKRQTRWGVSSVKVSPDDVKTQKRKDAAKSRVAIAHGGHVPDAGENSTTFVPQGG